MAIPSEIGRARLQQTPAGLQIVIPALGSWRIFFLRPLMVAFVIWGLQQRFEDSIVFVTILGVAAVAVLGKQWLWNLLGQEIVTVNKVALTLRYNLAGIGWQRNYFLNRVYGVSFLRRVTSQELKEASGGPSDNPRGGFVRFDYDAPSSLFDRGLSVAAAMLARFDYDPQSPRFGKGLNENEVKELIGVMERYTGVPLTSTRVPSPLPQHGGVLAQERNNNWGVTYVMGMGAGTFYYLGTLLDNPVQKYGAYLASLLFVGVAILALAGYRYRFTRNGIEISTLGCLVRSIPLERITHYEESTRAFADAYSFGIYGQRRAYVWAGRGVRIHTLDGEFFIGHMKPAILLRDLELMKQAASG